MCSRNLLLALLALCLTVLSACGEPAEVENPLYPGQTEFTNNEPASGGNDYRGGGGEWNSPQAGMDSNSKGTPAPPGAPPQGRTGEVEEADIYKVQDNKLFYLNTYRGFLIYDMADTKNPKVVSRLPVYGYPIEMFIQKNTVYALIRDALYLTQVKGKLQFKRHNVSQLVAIDITDLKNPKILQTVDIIGELREGVSRKIDDTVYVVSYISRYYYWGWSYNYDAQQQKEQAWVYAFNVADPKNLKLVDQLKIFEGGGYSDSTDHSYNSRYFQSVTISATSNALMVAENWRVYGYVKGSKYNCSTYQSLQQAVVSIVDISDPKGNIKLHTKFETYGELGDQFKQTYIFDETTKKGIYLGILARREWSSNDCHGSSLIKNTLESWDVTDGQNPKRLDDLAFGLPNETVRGSTFDADRGVAFAITARNTDPLYALSFSDPAQLKIRSEVGGLSGDMNVFRFIEDKKFLVAIGRDNSSACTGFGSPTTGWSTKVAVSVIDVQNLDGIRLVQRQCVAVQNASWVSSEINWNLDQAHKMIGMHSDGKANVITVPVYYYKKSDDGWWYYGYETAVGMMTWDLAKYDPQKGHEDQTVLQNFGTIIHPNGQVKRSVVFTHKGASERRKVINLSETHVSFVDIEDLKNPTTDAMIEVAPYHAELYRIQTLGGEYMVEHIRPQPYYYYSNDKLASEFRIKKVGGVLEQSPLVSSFTVANVDRVVPFKDKLGTSYLVIFRRVPELKTNKYGNYYDMKPEIVVYSLQDPKNPKKVSSLDPPGWFPYYYYYPWYWFGGDGFWGCYWFNYYGYGSDSFVMTDGGLVFLTASYDSATKSYERKLAFIDLTTPSQPAVKAFTLSSSTAWYFHGLVADPTNTSDFYLTYKVKVGEVTIDGDTFYQYKYYAQRWAWNTVKKSWVTGAAINLPGRLVKTWKQGSNQLFLTNDYTYKKVYVADWGHSTWQHTFRLNLLREVTPFGAPLGELLDTKPFTGYYLEGLVVADNKMFINAHPDYTTQKSQGLEWYEVSDYLMIYDLSQKTLKETYSQPTGTYQVSMMGTYKGKLFVNMPGDGILAVDVSNPAQPVGQQFMRTLGYATHLEFAGDTAYVSSGYFGVYQMDLKSAPALAYQ